MQQIDHVIRSAAAHAVHECLGRHLTIADRAADRLRDFPDSFGKGQQSRSGDFIKAIGVTIFGECGGHHVSDIVDVDERLRHWTGGQRDLAGQHAVDQIAFAEILIEPACTHDGPVDAARLQHGFRPLRAGLAAA